MALGQWAEAVVVWLALAENSGDQRFRLRAAYAAMDGDLDQRAVDILERLIQMSSDNADAHFALGIHHWKRNRLEPARDMFIAGLTLEETQPILTILGGIQRRLGDRAAARTLLERSITLRPDDDEAHYALAETVAREDLDASVKHFRRALEINSNFPHARRELGVVLWRQGHEEEAEHLLRKAILEDQSDAWAHDYLGHLLKGRDEWHDARDEFYSATMLEPQVGMFFSDLADAQSRLGQTVDAERNYLKALSLGVDDAHTLARYGLLLKQTGHLGRARTYLERALALDPTLRAARIAMTDLSKSSD